MYININDKTTLRQIQKAFSDFYPYLQIKFYKKPHKKYEASDEEDMIYPHNKIGNIKPTHVSGILEILPTYKVADVEKEFQQRFGLSVQILLKEKNEWEQTTGMDDFTLRELNELSRSSSDKLIVEEYEKGFEETPEEGPNLY